MRKLLSKQAGSPHEEPSINLPGSPVPLLYRPTGPQDALYQVGHPVAALDKSPDGRHAVLASQHTLQTVRIDGTEVSDVCDLRALITATQPLRTNANSAVNEQLSIRDVKWAPGHGDTILYTACGQGNIFRYDLAHIGTWPMVGGFGGGTGGVVGVDVIQAREDVRQINTLDINPHRSSYVLSGDQDGIMRCFDIRAPIPSRAGLTYRLLQSFRSNADSVRQVKWSPKEGFFFACATENGAVLKWDIRKSTAPVLRINGHDRACTSISWHPDGEHLISGGSDKKCHVWDMSKNAEKRQKPKYTLTTPECVSCVAWRPGQWSATCQGLRAAQVAVSYDSSGPRRSNCNAVHIWDLARPSIPYKTIERYDHSPAALLWKNQEFLWTAGTDGFFSQCDVAFAPQVIDRIPMSTLAFSSTGDVLTFLNERPPPLRPRLTTNLPQQQQHQQHSGDARSPSTATMPSSYGSDPMTPTTLSVSRSDSEDEAIRSFLSPRKRNRRKRRSSSVHHPLASTPSSQQSNRSSESALSLEQAILAVGTYRPQQIMAIGHIPSTARRDMYGYLTAEYLNTLKKVLPAASSSNAMVSSGAKTNAATTTPSLPERIQSIFEAYALAAENVSQYRLAQVWRILALAVDLLLQRRAQYHLAKRLNASRKKTSPSMRTKNERKLSMGSDGTTTTTSRPPIRSLLTEEIESTSNVPTPLVRPSQSQTDQTSMDELALPPALQQQQHKEFLSRQPERRRLDSQPISESSQGSESTRLSSQEGYDFYDTEALTRAIRMPENNHVNSRNSNSNNSGNNNGLTRQTSPIRRLSIMRQDSDGSTSGGQIFRMSQVSAGGVASTPEASQQDSQKSAEENSQTAEPKPSRRTARLARLNKALLAIDWSGSDLGSVPEGTGVDFVLGSTPEKSLSALSAFPWKDVAARAQRNNSGNINNTNNNKCSTNTNTNKNNLQPEMGGPDHITELDYLPWSGDPTYPFVDDDEHDKDGYQDTPPPPLNPYTVIQRALSFETRTSSLNAAAMVLVLKPLVPDDVIDPLQATAILRQYHTRLMGMQLLLDAALLRKLCVQGWPSSGSDRGNGSISLEDDLKYWGTSYPSVTATATHHVAVSYLCAHCKRPHHTERVRSGGLRGSIWVCNRCRTVMAPCAVCGHRDESAMPSLSSSSNVALPLSTWWYCTGCGHGGHAACLEQWHSASRSSKKKGNHTQQQQQQQQQQLASDELDSKFSGGCCPLDGCGHACLPGRWRSESIAARSEELALAVRGASVGTVTGGGGGAAVGPGSGSGSGGGGGPGPGRMSRSSSRLGVANRGFPGYGASTTGGGGGGGAGGGGGGGGGKLSSFDDVRADRNEVVQSRAVDSVRESLASRDMTRLSREKERRKSVKFAGTEGT